MNNCISLSKMSFLEYISVLTYQITRWTSRIVAPCRESKKARSGLPSSPIRAIMPPKKMENTTRPRMFVPDADTTLGSSVYMTVAAEMSQYIGMTEDVRSRGRQ